MPVPVSVSMPPEITAADGYVLRWRAVSPADGSDVANVTITAVTVQAADTPGAVAGEQLGPFMLVPGPGA